MEAVAIPFPERGEPTVRELVSAYLELAGPDLKRRSLVLTRRYLNAFASEFGSRRCSELRRSDLKRWIRDQGQWRANATKRSAINRVKACLNWAVKDDRIKHMPFAGVSWKDSRPRRSMTDDEYLRAVRAASRPFRSVLFFARLTGARPGEIAALEWAMIDWERSTATLHEHKTDKTDEPRVIFLPPLAIRFLRVRQRNRLPHEQRRVFSNSRGTRWTDCQLSYHMRRTREAAGLAADCLLYGLRHRFATLSAMRNDISVTAKLLGHRTIKTTAKYYVHLDEHRDFLLDAARKVNEKS